MICDYNNLWSSYLTFKNEAAIEHLIDYLKKVRKERGLRNPCVFCPRKLADARVHIIAHRFILECIRKIGGIDHIVKAQDETFNPNYRILSSKGNRDDLEALAKILTTRYP